MKILFNTYPYAFHTPGGGEIQLLQYKKSLSDLGIKIELLDQWNPSFNDMDIVHSFSCQPDLLHFCAFVKKIGLPLVVSPNLWIREKTKHLYGFDDIRMQFCLADRIVCNSDMECDLLAQTFNIPRECFFTVYNGVDDMFFNPVDPSIFREHFGIQGPFLLNVANIEPRKNQLKIAEVIKKFPDMKFLLIGHKRDPEYAQQCYAKGGDQFCYLGSLPHDSPLLRSAYAACEAFILPSKLETPGLAALEAMAAGAKVIVTSEGSTREYFGDGAIYINPDDSNDIAKGISLALLEKKQQLTSFVMRANFSWDYVIQSLSNLYSGLSCSRKIDKKNKLIGFHQIEKDSYGLFVWTTEQLVFKMKGGLLRFFWQSYDGTEVNIYVDGVLKRTVFVRNEWHPFELQIISKHNQQESQIRLIISKTANVYGTDPRVLGVAIRDVIWEQSPVLEAPIMK